MTFSSYASSAETVVNPALQFDIDYDGTDMSTAYQGRLTFEPAGAPTPDTWESQDALAPRLPDVVRPHALSEQSSRRGGARSDGSHLLRHDP
jgi:hypothetical protein